MATKNAFKLDDPLQPVFISGAPSSTAKSTAATVAPTGLGKAAKELILTPSPGEKKLAKKVFQPPAPTGAMAFPVGAGLSAQQQKQAELVVGTPAGEAAKKLSQDPLIIRVGRSAARTAASVTMNQTADPLRPVTRAERFVFGSEPIKPLAQETTDLELAFKQSGGAKGKFALPLSFALTVVPAALDLFPGLPDKKQAAKELADYITKQATKKLATKEIVEQVAEKFGKAAASEAERVLTQTTKLAERKTIQEISNVDAKAALINQKDAIVRNVKRAAPEFQDMVNSGKASMEEWDKLEKIIISPNQSLNTIAEQRQVMELLQSKGIDPLAGKAGFSKKAVVEDLTQNPQAGFAKIPFVSEPKPLSPAEKYVEELVTKREAVRAGESPGLLGKVKAFYQDVKTKLVDSNAPIEDALNSAEKKYGFRVTPSNDVRIQIDRVLRAPTLAGQFARDNGLEEIIKSVDNLDNLDQYLIAKQAQSVEARGFATGRNLTRDRQLITEFAPKYEQASGKVTQYSQKLLDYSVQSGLVSADVARQLKEIYPDYVPINRVFSELEKAGQFNTKAVATLSKQTVVQGLKGSTREIESPVASLLAKTNDAFIQGEKNQAARILASYKDLPGFTGMMRELPKGESAPYTFSFLENGVKRTFATTREIATAAKSLNVQQLNILGKIFALPVRVAKLGITGYNLPFVGANVVRDQLFTAVTSNNTLRTSLANPVNFIRSLFSVVKHDELYEQMVRAGAGGTSFDIARNQASQTVGRIRAGRSVGSKVAYTIRHPSELLRTVEDIIGRSEELTRMTQFRGTKQALLAQGRTEADAILLAGKAARENSANFLRHGEWGPVLNSAFLYLNAGIQGSRSLVRAFAQAPVKTAAKVASVVFLPVAAATAWNLKDPKRRGVYEDIADYEKKGNIVIIPPNPTKDEKGRWNVIKLPLPPGLSNLASPVRKALEQAFGLDRVKFSDIATALVGAVSPIEPDKGSILSTLTPQAIKPALEATTNQNFFTGLPQVPDSQKDLSPENQVRKTTSGTARKIGGALGASPIKVEEFIKGTFGGVGAQALNATDRVLAGLDLIPKDQIGGQSVTDAILARFNKARGGEADKKSNDQLKAVLQKQADERFRLKQEAEILYSELKTVPADQANAKAKELKKANPQLYEKLKDVAADAKLGLTYNDRLINQLGVENGERARFIYESTKALKTPQDKNAYISELKRKKIVSDQVLKQIKSLIKQDAGK